MPHYPSPSGACRAVISLVACGTLLAATPPVEAQHASDIDTFVDGLRYDPATLLRFPEAPEFRLSRPWDNGQRVVTCEWADVDLAGDHRSSSFSILAGMHGVVFPGAMLRANARLLEGRPDAVSLPLAPVTVRVSLPGLGERAVRTVENPTYTAVESAVDDVVANALSMPGGVTNAMKASFSTAELRTAQQASVELGLTANVAGTNASAAFSGYTDSRHHSYVGLYRQVFFTAAIDPPATPGAAFAPDVDVPQLRRVLDADNPPAYVRSVDYGRLILVRMDVDRSEEGLDAKAAMEYGAGQTNLSGEAAARARRALEKSRVSVFILGGGPEASAIVFQPGEDKDERLRRTIREFSALSPTNPARPVGYTVNFLRDHASAVVQLPTSFRTQQCSTGRRSHIRLVQQGGFMGGFRVEWRQIEPDGTRSRHDWNSGRVAAGYRYNFPMEASARDIKVQGYAWNGSREIDTERRRMAYANGQCVRLTGALPNPRQDASCN